MNTLTVNVSKWIKRAIEQSSQSDYWLSDKHWRVCLSTAMSVVLLVSTVVCVGPWPHRRLSDPDHSNWLRCLGDAQHCTCHVCLWANAAWEKRLWESTDEFVKPEKLFSDMTVLWFLLHKANFQSPFSFEILFFSLSLFLSLHQMAVDVLEGLLEEDDEVVQVSNEVMAQLSHVVVSILFPALNVSDRNL